MFRLSGNEKRLGVEAKSIAASLVCHIIWGFSFLASRTALDSASVFLVLSHRFLSAFLMMSVVALFKPSLLHLKGKRVWLLSLLGLAEPVIYFIGEQYGLLHSNTIFSGVMIAMIPILSTLLAAPVLHEKPSVGQLLFSVLSVSGVVGVGLMSSSAGALDWIGVLCLVISILSAGAYAMLNRGLSGEFTPFERTWVMLCFGAVAFTAIAAIECRGNVAAYVSPLSDPKYTFSVLFLSLFCSIVCYFLSCYALTYLTIARKTVFSNLTTVVSVFAGAVILHEPFTWKGAVFCLLILIGIYGVQRTAPKLKKQKI